MSKQFAITVDCGSKVSVGDTVKVYGKDNLFFKGKIVELPSYRHMGCFCLAFSDGSLVTIARDHFIVIKKVGICKDRCTI